ncbi:hypothetical protein ACFFRR_000893 [Megaselia abdita]
MVFDKQKINNHLVASKKRVRQARIQCINKIVQKIRKVSEYLEKHPDDIKSKDKLRKTEQVLLELKKVNHVKLLRKAIIYEGNPETVITNGSSSPEEVAEALFVSHTAIKEIVTEVIEKYCLDDEANPGWKDQITAASKKSQKDEKLENKKRKRAEKKQKTAQEKKRLEWLKENKIEGSEAQAEDLSDMLSKPAVNSKVKAIVPPKAKKQKKTLIEESEEAHPITKKAKFTPALVIKPKAGKHSITVTSEEESEDEALIHEESYADSEKEESQSEEDNYSEHEEMESFEGENEESESEVEEEVTESVKKVIDPFFTTSSGEPYKAIAIPERVQPGSKSDGLVRRDRRDNMMGRTSKPRKPKALEYEENEINSFNNQKSSWTEDHSKSEGKIHPSWAAKQKQNGIQGFAGKKISFGENGEDSSPKQNDKIHPSWAAKQKQKGIQGFAGKKISFGENGEDSSPKQNDKIHPSWAAKQKQKGIQGFVGKKISFAENGEDSSPKQNDKIHPSWAAKQKQKGIQGFAGKKISFGESAEDFSLKHISNQKLKYERASEVKSRKPDEKLHPSWLAKQKLKPVISSFQGKKISFGDDD